MTTMMLKELIEKLESQKDKERIIKKGFHAPHSYRGDYHQLAFEETENITIAKMLEIVKSAHSKEFTGYKGGEFTMHDFTYVYIAEYGSSGYQLNEITLDCMLENNILKDGEIAVKTSKIDEIITYTITSKDTGDFKLNIVEMLEELKKG